MPGPKRRVWLPEECDLVRQWVAEGKTQRVIAGALGVSHQSIHRLVRTHGLESLEGPVAAGRRRTSKALAAEMRRRDARDDLRVRVYEAALGRTRGQLAEALPDVSGRTVDGILADLCVPLRTQGSWLPAVLKVRGDGTYVRESDPDMVHEKEPRTPGIRRHGRAA